MKYYSVEDIHAGIQSGKMIILDVREKYEYEICSIQSIQIPMDEIFARTNEIPQDIIVAVMCRSGKRAEAVANLLTTENNFKNLVIMQGGILAWIEKFATHLESY